MLKIDKIKNNKINTFKKFGKDVYLLFFENEKIRLDLRVSDLEDDFLLIYLFEVDFVDMNFRDFYKNVNLFMKNAHDQELYSKDSSFLRNRKYNYNSYATEKSDDFSARITFNLICSKSDMQIDFEKEFSFFSLKEDYPEIQEEDSIVLNSLYENSIQIMQSSNTKNFFNSILKNKQLANNEKVDLIELNFKI